jgi:hypothetical protein
MRPLSFGIFGDALQGFSPLLESHFTADPPSICLHEEIHSHINPSKGGDIVQRDSNW